METAITATVINPQELLVHWQGHRSLTRRVIEAFPEKELFEFSIGGMRPFAKMILELLAIGGPGITEIATGISKPFNEGGEAFSSKTELLKKWDKETEVINEHFSSLTLDKFHEMNNLFGEYKFPAINNILYFIDNEIHHRGQGYVYLRALGIEPPAFWER